MNRLARDLAPLAALAKDLGVRMGMENPFSYSSRPEDLIALCTICGHGLGECLDLGNFCFGQDPISICQKLAPHAAAHVHFSRPVNLTH